MIDSGYSRCGSGRRGFRVNQYKKRLSIKTVRAKFVSLLRLLSRWRRALRGICRESNPAIRRRLQEIESNNSRSRSRKPLVNYYVWSNSFFYSEAIKECLEFIKRNSISAVDQSELIELEDDRVWVPPEFEGPWINLSFNERILPNSILLPKIV